MIKENNKRCFVMRISILKNMGSSRNYSIKFKTFWNFTLWENTRFHTSLVTLSVYVVNFCIYVSNGQIQMWTELTETKKVGGSQHFSSCCMTENKTGGACYLVKGCNVTVKKNHKDFFFVLLWRHLDFIKLTCINRRSIFAIVLYLSIVLIPCR